MTSTRTLITPEMPAGGAALGPGAMLDALWRQRRVTRKLGSRQVQMRHRGTVFGVAWTVLNPLLLLAVYTLIFTGVLQVGGSSTAERIAFAVQMFCGMVVFSVFADTISRAPLLITSRPNYVKKVVFPLEALVTAELYASLVLGAASLLVLLVAVAVVHGGFAITALALPLVLPPLVLLTLGAAWFVAALSVYVRDVATSIGVVVTILFFLTPVFWQVGQWPEDLQTYVWLNPLAVLIESARDCLLRDRWPDGTRLLLTYIESFGVAWLGFAWFRHGKRGFADVL
ncbi:MAG TPA: ABC transporter permease [bacterium]|nr:ABC transporter permease [bacterium]